MILVNDLCFYYTTNGTNIPYKFKYWKIRIMMSDSNNNKNKPDISRETNKNPNSKYFALNDQ